MSDARDEILNYVFFDYAYGDEANAEADRLYAAVRAEVLREAAKEIEHDADFVAASDGAEFANGMEWAATKLTLKADNIAAAKS